MAEQEPLFERLKLFFDRVNPAESSKVDELSADELQIACCVILLETAFVDLSFPPSEQQVILKAMRSFCSVDDLAAEDLIDLAELVRIHRQSIAPIMSAINTHLNVAQKQLLYATVWQVIKADDEVHRHEISTATKVAQLLKLDVDEEIEARRMIIHGMYPGESSSGS